MIKAIQGGTFNTDCHEYRSEAGLWIPSLTQVLAASKIVDHDGIPEATLRNAADRGTRCHWHTECYDVDGFTPPPWTPEEELIRFNGYKEWKHRNNFIPDRVELAVVFSVYGMQCACTVDRVGTLNGEPTIVELKFTYAPEKYWGIQLAGQEIAINGRTEIGAYKRVVCHVNSKGKAKTIPFNDPYDAQRFIFALGTVWTRIDLGEDIRRKVIDVVEDL